MAYTTIQFLVDRPREAVAYLSARLHSVAPPNAKRISRLIGELDSEEFTERTNATQELEELGELAETALRDALKARGALERRRRIETLLRKLETAVRTKEQLREIRAIEVLERIGDARSRAILEKLAKGFPGASLTKEACDSIRRLGKRSCGVDGSICVGNLW